MQHALPQPWSAFRWNYFLIYGFLRITIPLCSKHRMPKRMPLLVAKDSFAFGSCIVNLSSMSDPGHISRKMYYSGGFTTGLTDWVGETMAGLTSQNNDYRARFTGMSVTTKRCGWVELLYGGSD